MSFIELVHSTQIYGWDDLQLYLPGIYSPAKFILANILVKKFKKKSEFYLKVENCCLTKISNLLIKCQFSVFVSSYLFCGSNSFDFVYFVWI